jgi:hypothetical protein
MPKGYLNDEQLKIWAQYISVKDASLSRTKMYQV